MAYLPGTLNLFAWTEQSMEKTSVIAGNTLWTITIDESDPQSLLDRASTGNLKRDMANVVSFLLLYSIFLLSCLFLALLRPENF
jgi:hypothetical protein